MTSAICSNYSMINYSALTCREGVFAEVENKVSLLFAQVKKWIAPGLEGRPCRLMPNLQGLYSRPDALIEGAFWGAFVVFGAYCLAQSGGKLLTRCIVESAAHEQLEKIGEVVKAAFVDLLSFCSSVTYFIRWTDAAEIISLGAYLPFVNYLCYGLSIVISMSEVLAGGFEMRSEGAAIVQERCQSHRELHHKRLFCAMMRVVASVSTVAWASIRIGALAGVVVPSFVAPFFLTVACVVGVAAWVYKPHIDSQVIPGVTRLG